MVANTHQLGGSSIRVGGVKDCFRICWIKNSVEEGAGEEMRDDHLKKTETLGGLFIEVGSEDPPTSWT